MCGANAGTCGHVVQKSVQKYKKNMIPANKIAYFNKIQLFWANKIINDKLTTRI